MPTDEAAEGMCVIVADLRRKDAVVFVTEPGGAVAGCLPILQPDRSEAEAACLIRTFSAFIVGLAPRRGTSVDRLRHLRKVTRIQ